jgi:CRISPR-associated protein Cas5h
MEKTKVISFTLEGDFGFLRKPETNEGVQLSFNMLHKPALLGILGAILGLGGYREKGEWPEYYQQLQGTKVGIAPQVNKHERGNFPKTILTYTNGVGYANADGNLIITESTLVDIGYRIYILIDPENEWHVKLEEYLQEGEAVFLPYLGKNECFTWWEKEQVEVFDVAPHDFKDESFVIDTIFFKDQAVSSERAQNSGSLIFDDLGSDNFLYFERLPIGFDEKLFQYEYSDFAFSNCKWQAEAPIQQLYMLSDDSNSCIVQLF